MDEQHPTNAGDPTPEPKSADSFAGWAPGPRDAIPILPRGTALFEAIPARAIVVEALSPVIGNGALLTRRPGAVGVILVKDGGLFEVDAFEGGVRLEGTEALQRIASWDDANMSAYQFDPIVVAVAPSLFRGSPCYEDLRLEWTDWKGLLTDLCSREGLFVVELNTPLGRGVTLIVNGRQVATYTETHPELGNEGLLDPLAATKRGTIWVRREPGDEVAARETGPDAEKPVTAPSEAESGDQAVTAPQPVPTGSGPVPISVGIDWSTTPLRRAEPASGAAPAAGPAAPFTAFTSAAPQASPRASAWKAGAPDTYPGPSEAPYEPADPSSVAAIATALKRLARLRLQRSAPRVEAMVDQAVEQNLSLDALLNEIRGLVIRGVMQSTLDEVADEMAAMASAPPPG
jgi:hypothetical protein